MEESHTTANIFGLVLVILIAAIGLAVMFNEVDITGKASVHISSSTLVGCNEGEILLTARGVEALKHRGREMYGSQFSPYKDAKINYNGVGYCTNAEIAHLLLG